MKNTFKKSLLALALTGFASGAMAAGSGVIDLAAAKTAADATVDGSNDTVGTATGAFTYGKEYLANFTGASVASADLDNGIAARFITYTAPVAIGIDHSFKFDITNGAIEAATDLELRLGATDAVVAELIDFVADSNGNYTSVTFKFDTAIAVDDVVYFASNASLAPLTGVVIVPNAGISSDVTVALTQAKDASALTLTAPLAPAETLITTLQQFTAFSVTDEVAAPAEDSVTSVIDVDADRELFTGAASVTTDATINLTINDVDVGIDVDASEYTLSLVDAKNVGVITAIDGIDGVSAAAANLVDAEEDGNWAFTQADIDEVDGSTYAITVTGTDRIEEAEYSYSLSINPSNADTDSFDVGTDVGHTWELNAATAMIPYMPYASNINQIIYVTNKGAAVGDITVDVWNEAGTLIVDGAAVGQTKANGITKITGEVLQLVTDAGVTNEKVRIQVVANIPQDEMEVYSAYNANSSDRGLVINNSNVTTNRD